eukprot:2080884-Pyramimonas_sp.AAC.1
MKWLRHTARARYGNGSLGGSGSVSGSGSLSGSDYGGGGSGRHRPGRGQVNVRNDGAGRRRRYRRRGSHGGLRLLGRSPPEGERALSARRLQMDPYDT